MPINEKPAMMPQMLPIVPGKGRRWEYVCLYIRNIVGSRLTEDLVPGVFNNLTAVLNVRFGKVNTHHAQRGAVASVTVMGMGDAAKLNSIMATEL